VVSKVLRLHRLAKAMKQAQDGVRQITPFSAQDPTFAQPDGYAVAALVHDQRCGTGARAVGRKIGFTNRHMWSAYGVSAPVWGYVYQSSVVYSAGLEACCDIAPFVEPKIEPEIVAHFHRAPLPGSTTDEILACIDWFAHAFEVVQSHFPGWRFQAADTIADNALHASLLIGPCVAPADLGPGLRQSLEQFHITLSCDGAVRAQGCGRDVLGGPLQAIAHLIQLLHAQPHAKAVQAGELVTTGTLTAAMPVEAGQRWHTRLQGTALPGLSVQIVRHEKDVR
jgi:2-keto-4-pentenoate hydratase